MKKSQYVALLLLGLLVIGVTGGVWTSNEFIYKPSLGARGQTEKDSFDVGMDRIDARLAKEIYVTDPLYGAVGDGVADDTTAINAAAAAARSTGKELVLPACAAYYKVTGQLDLRQLNVNGIGKIISSYAGAAVLVGNASKLSVKVQVDRTLDWTDGVVGIQITSDNVTENCWFDFSSTHNNIGVKVIAGAQSCCYNTFLLREIKFNKVGMMVHTPSGAAGWTNENTVFGGNFGNTNAGAECCVKFLGEGTNGIEHWVFVKPSFEYTTVTAAVITTNTQNLDMQTVRYECASTVPVAQFNDKSYANIIKLDTVGHAPFTWNVADLSTSANGTNGCDVRMVGDGPGHRLTDASSFAAAYHDGTYLHVPGYEIINPNVTPGTASRKANTSQWNLKDGDGGACLSYTGASYEVIGLTVNFNYAAAAFPNLQWAKKLVIGNRLLGSTDYTVIYVKCYDAAGNVLSGASPPYVQGNQWAAVNSFYRINYAGHEQSLIFHPAVARAFVGTQANANCQGLEIFAPYQAHGYLSYTGPKELPGVLYAANAPTKWHFQVGETVRNDAPVVGAPAGWVCSKRTETTLTANGSGGATTLTVNSITGLASGDVIGVKLDTGLYHFTTINGAPSGSTVTLTAALPGSGVVATSGNAVVANLWRAMANL